MIRLLYEKHKIIRPKQNFVVYFLTNNSALTLSSTENIIRSLAREVLSKELKVPLAQGASFSPINYMYLLENNLAEAFAEQ